MSKLLKLWFCDISDLSSGSVLGLIKATRECTNSYITHGGSTEISSHVESPRGISESEISSFQAIFSL